MHHYWSGVSTYTAPHADHYWSEHEAVVVDTTLPGSSAYPPAGDSGSDVHTGKELL